MKTFQNVHTLKHKRKSEHWSMNKDNEKWKFKWRRWTVHICGNLQNAFWSIYNSYYYIECIKKHINPIRFHEQQELWTINTCNRWNSATITEMHIQSAKMMNYAQDQRNARIYTVKMMNRLHTSCRTEIQKQCVLRLYTPPSPMKASFSSTNVYFSQSLTHRIYLLSEPKIHFQWNIPPVKCSSLFYRQKFDASLFSINLH